MTSFDAYDLISLWERDPGLPPAEKAAHLLRLVSPHIEEQALSRVTLGQRDRALLSARRELFGDALEAAATCDGCGADLEVSLRVTDLLDMDGGAALGGAAGPVSIDLSDSTGDHEGVTVKLRAPTVADALSAARTSSSSDPRRALIRACVIEATRDGEPIALKPDALDALGPHIDALDPLSEIRLNLTCAECEHAQSVQLDIGSYLWNELVGEAERLLEEVCSLARAYGWREADILAMSGERRKFYLARAM
jgi:hypothetical protein